MTLDHLSLPELKQLSVRIAKEIDKRQSSSRSDLLKNLQKLAGEYGLTLEQVARGIDATAITRTPPTGARVPVPAKYRSPNNRELAWSGRGRQPHWVSAWLANGGTLDALEVAAQKYRPRPAPGAAPAHAAARRDSGRTRTAPPSPPANPQAE